MAFNVLASLKTGVVRGQERETKTTPLYLCPLCAFVFRAPFIAHFGSEGMDGKVDLEAIVLGRLGSAEEGIADSLEYAKELGVDHQVLIGVCKSLLTDFYATETSERTDSVWTLTEEGANVASDGSPEFQVYKAVPEGDDGISMGDLQGLVGAACKLGLGPCMKNKWLKKNGDRITKIKADARDETAEMLQAIGASGGDVDSTLVPVKELQNLKKRKLVSQVSRKVFSFAKGPSWRPERVRKMVGLTREMLGDKADMPPGMTHWSDHAFKEVNLNAMGAPVGGGNFHPLLKVRAEFRRILMEMGFEEMPTAKWVESSFWNFDSLFQPQSHPARDAHDTFFIKSPAACNSVIEDYYERVKTVHTDGGYGSVGYGEGTFKREVAFQNILRTHTTAISAQMLYKLANQPGGFTPRKYFSIDRVFRNEAMDATHLCEFHQVEGLVADYNLNLGHLIGTIKTFFEKIGITEVRFKPAYNPYTEPSMEIFGYHPELKKWTELGNSGMFRPEMLRPMGLPEGVRVIAWGLSLERPTMIKYKMNNIRDLFGHKADLNAQAAAPLARYF